MTPASHRQIKAGYFALAALNTLAACYYANYLFFFLRDEFAFGNRENLWASALHGFIYTFAAVQCGRFAQRRGYTVSLKVGFASLAALMVVGAVWDGVIAMMVVLAGFSVGLLFIWPALEALTSERESPAGLRRMVGIYNCTWAGAAAVAYFTGGKLYDALGKGALFWLPAGIYAVQFVMTLWLEKQSALTGSATACSPSDGKRDELRDAIKDNLPPTPEAVAFQQPVRPEMFLKMAWFANPFAYIAINTLLAVMPGIAHRLGLSPTQVGLFCSIWLFSRLAAFALLWHWPGWHYRFRWLLLAFVMLVGSFAAILLARDLWLVIGAQLFFGLATGLIYYSSLFYSMDAGDAKGEHGGWHEAFIGVGICLGPAVGAAALQLAPGRPHAGTWAVSGLLVLGLLGLLWLRFRRR